MERNLLFEVGETQTCKEETAAVRGRQRMSSRGKKSCEPSKASYWLSTSITDQVESSGGANLICPRSAGIRRPDFKNKLESVALLTTSLE